MGEHADMTEARSYMQRGLRFCKGSETLWLEYMKLELHYVAKLTARQQILGIDRPSKPERPNQSMGDMNADLVKPPQINTEDIRTSQDARNNVDDASIQTVAKASALSGAILIAIFDAAMIQFEDDDTLAQHLFDTVQEFDSVSCLQNVLKHIADHMLSCQPSSWRTLVCYMKVSCVGIPVTSPEFPQAFGKSVKILRGAPSAMRSCMGLIDALQKWLELFLKNDSLDTAIRQIMLSILGQLQAAAEVGHASIEAED